MNYIDIVLILLVIAGIWAVVEIALTVRSARKSIEEVTVSANQTIEQAQPIIAKLDGMMDDLDPTIKQIPALMEKVDTTVDSANTSLESLNVVLGDVAAVSGAASAVTATVSKAASDAVSGVVDSVSKLGSGIGSVVNPQSLPLPLRLAFTVLQKKQEKERMKFWKSFLCCLRREHLQSPSMKALHMLTMVMRPREQNPLLW